MSDTVAFDFCEWVDSDGIMFNGPCLWDWEARVYFGWPCMVNHSIGFPDITVPNICLYFVHYTSFNGNLTSFDGSLIYHSYLFVLLSSIYIMVLLKVVGQP